MMEYLRYHGIPFRVVLTKIDKLKKSQLAVLEKQFREYCAPYGCEGTSPVSSEKGTGVPELQALMASFLEKDGD